MCALSCRNLQELKNVPYLLYGRLKEAQEPVSYTHLQAGTAILNIRGIIAPGTYQNYLQYEFESANGLVVAHNVYC